MSEQPPDDSVQPQRSQKSQQQTDDELAFPDLKPGDAWGESITRRRADELQEILQIWERETETEHGGRRGPFDDKELTGADALWLAKKSGLDSFRSAPNLHLEGADLREAHLEGADLGSAHLEHAFLYHAHLEHAFLNEAHLENADLSNARLDSAILTNTHLEYAILTDAYLEKADVVAYLKNADLGGAYLEGARLDEAHLEGANLREADLKGAHLRGAYLEGARLDEAHLEGAILHEAHLEGAILREAHLEGATLIGAWMDSKTVLSDAILDTMTRLGDIQWSGTGMVNLTQLDWRHMIRLGDETTLKPDAAAEEYEIAVRAYRQVAVQLHAQGLSEVADRFLYRAQVVQRRVLRKQRKLGGYLFSLLLALLAGYGYRLGRIIIAYTLVVGVFAAAFLASDVLSGQMPLTAQGAFDALQISLNAVHGRVFFAQFHLDTLQSWLATAESIVGIVIEGVFVAMLIQRFFGR